MKTRPVTRKGKVARLPYEVRAEVNSRIAKGEPGTRIVAWLNSLPKVHEILAGLFQSEPISPQNLSEWKKRGYVDWLKLNRPASGAGEGSAPEAAPLNTEDLLKLASARFGYVAGADWERQRCAVLAVACAEFAERSPAVPPVKLRREIVERYRSLPLSGGKRLRLSRTVFVGAFAKWVASGASSPAALAFVARNVSGNRGKGA